MSYPVSSFSLPRNSPSLAAVRQQAPACHDSRSVSALRVAMCTPRLGCECATGLSPSPQMTWRCQVEGLVRGTVLSNPRHAMSRTGVRMGIAASLPDILVWNESTTSPYIYILIFRGELGGTEGCRRRGPFLMLSIFYSIRAVNGIHGTAQKVIINPLLQLKGIIFPTRKYMQDSAGERSLDYTYYTHGGQERISHVCL